MYLKTNNTVYFNEENRKVITFSIDCFKKEDAYLAATYMYETGDWYVNRLYVSKPLRGRRYGSLLLSSFLEYCDSTKNYALIDIIPEDGLKYNELVEFYKRYGFIETKFSEDNDTYMYTSNTMCVNRTAFRIKKKLHTVGIEVREIENVSYRKHVTLKLKYIEIYDPIYVLSNYSDIYYNYNKITTGDSTERQVFFRFNKQMFYSEDELVGFIYKIVYGKEMTNRLKHHVNNICNESFKEPIYISFAEQEVK